MRRLFLVSATIVACGILGGNDAKVLSGPVQMQAGTFLRVEGTDFMYGDDKVYLSGTNPAWVQYGYDFGNNHWEAETGEIWTQEVTEIGNAGGNSIRVWVHVEGYDNPQFDDDGFVIGTDAAGTLIPDLLAFLDVCQENGVFLDLVLWNGAVMSNDNYRNLLFDDAKLQSYLDNALTPMVLALSGHPALGIWETMNEPEGLTSSSQTNAEPCFDTTHLTYASDNPNDPGWAEDIPMENVLKFLNWQASTIHSLNPNAIVTTGSWSPYATTDASFLVEDSVFKTPLNHYSDDCLIKAGGRPDGTMDFWQFHVYPYQQQWGSGAPWLGYNPDIYEVDAPLVIGEFPAALHGANHDDHQVPDPWTTESMCTYLYENDFDGGWTWFFGSQNTDEEDADVLTGMSALEGRTDHGVVDVNIG